MIIRRRHTANFTTIGNALFNDERLAADELGVLAFLLSRPSDWEVRRPALARRFKFGRITIKRILLNLIQCGWIIAQKTRLQNGTFHTLYEVLDDPGPSLTAEEAKAATSSVSDDADLSEMPSDEAALSGPEPGPPPDIPGTGSPGVAYQVSPTCSGPIDDSLRTESVRNDSTQQVRVFLDVRSAWPRDNILSEVAAQSAFLSLTDQAKDDCYNGVKPYLDDCRVQNRKVCDLTTFIRERRWERFKATKKADGAVSIFKIRSAQWYRWREYKIAIGQPIKFMDSYAISNPDGVWSESSDWPPPVPKETKPSDDNSGADPPEGALATEEELNQFGKTG